MTSNAFKWKMVGAFAALYLIWGSTYLAIRFALETLPPLTMAGARFVVAGVILYGSARLRGWPSPSRRHWPTALVIGALFVLLGNGGVVWAEQTLSSGMTALLIATQPLFLVLLDWLRPGGRRPSWTVTSGVILGFSGTCLLLSPWSAADTAAFNWLGASSVLLASVAWAAGSLYALRAQQPGSPFLSTGMQMLCGGICLLMVGVLTGEWKTIDLANASVRSWIAVLYLLVFGSLIAFTAYVWLLRATTPARASTYAFVNPVVAVFLGWLLAGEVVTSKMLLAMSVIIASVVLIITRQGEAVPEALVQSETARAGVDGLCPQDNPRAGF
jgi:drug/metabolite transporter (DMT)-like permease